MSARLSRRARRSGVLSRALPSIALSLVVLVVGWSAFWLFARAEAVRNLEAWIAAEREAGRIWTCPDRSLGGFPLDIELRCETPTFAEAAETGFHGQVAALKASAPLYLPTDIAIDLSGPLTIRDMGADAGLVVNWAAARVTLRGSPGKLDRGHLEAAGVELAAAPGRAPTRIGSASVAFQPLPQKAAADLTADIADLRDPDANAVFGSADPITVAVTATVNEMPSRGASLPTLLEQWRQAGGDLDVTRFAFVKGSFSARGSGILTIDEQHRPAGRLQARFAGLAPLAARFGIPVAAVKIGGLLSGLLGGKPGSGDAEKTDLDLPIVAREGHLYLGPAKTGLVLPPLY